MKDFRRRRCNSNSGRVDKFPEILSSREGNGYYINTKIKTSYFLEKMYFFDELQ